MTYEKLGVENVDVPHWFGDGMHDADCRHWLPYLDAETIGAEPDRKLTLPLPVAFLLPVKKVAV